MTFEPCRKTALAVINFDDGCYCSFSVAIDGYLLRFTVLCAARGNEQHEDYFSWPLLTVANAPIKSLSGAWSEEKVASNRRLVFFEYRAWYTLSAHAPKLPGKLVIP